MISNSMIVWYGSQVIEYYVYIGPPSHKIEDYDILWYIMIYDIWYIMIYYDILWYTIYGSQVIEYYVYIGPPSHKIEDYDTE